MKKDIKLGLSIISFIFPIFMFPFIFINYIKNGDLKKNLVYSIAVASFYFKRVDFTGDVEKYRRSFECFLKNFVEKESFLSLFHFGEGKYYYFWSSLNYVIKKLNLKFDVVTFISMLIMFSTVFYIFKIVDIENNKKIMSKIRWKFFLVISLITLFSSYKSTIAYTLVICGIYVDILEKKRWKTYILWFIGLGYHASAISLILLYILSLVIKINKKRLFFYCGIATVISIPIFILFLKFLKLFFKFYHDRLMIYVFGRWGEFKLYKSELVTYYLVCIILVTVIYSIKKVYKIKNKKLEKYNNYIMLYLIFLFLILPYRTLIIRFVISAFTIYTLLFYEVFLLKCKKRVFQILWLFLFDLRVFTMFTASYYIFNKNNFLLLNSFSFFKDFIN